MPALTAAASGAWSPSTVVDERDVLVPGLDAEPEPLGSVDPRVVEPPRPDVKAGGCRSANGGMPRAPGGPRAAHDPLRVDPGLVIGIGITVVVIGVAILLLSRLGIHRLPGDIVIHPRHFTL